MAALSPFLSRSPLDREIGRLAIPALGALIAEPLFLLTDTALVGHLGAVALAGVGLASVVLQTVIGLLVFLAYATTPTVARQLGLGDRPGAIAAGIDGMWLALGLGIVLLVVGIPAAAPLIGLFGSTEAVRTVGASYLVVSFLGMPAMLVVVAATGLLRGLQDTRTPLVVAGAGFAANAALNAVLIYGLGWGAVGSAVGTVLVQWAMAVVYAVLAIRSARAGGARIRPSVAALRELAPASGWLFLRTVTLRATLLLTTAVAADLGVPVLAAAQIGLNVFFALALALDALAIAAQALIGHESGATQTDRLSSLTRRFIGLGVLSGAALAIVPAVAAFVAGPVFTSDDAVRSLLPVAFLVLAAALPLAGFVFVLDGILIGWGDGRYLALAGGVNLVVYAACIAPVAILAPSDPLVSTTLLWLAFAVGMLGPRAGTLGMRARRLLRHTGD